MNLADNPTLQQQLEIFLTLVMPQPQGSQIISGRLMKYSVRASYEHHIAFQRDAIDRDGKPRFIGFKFGYGMQTQIVGLEFNEDMLAVYEPDDDDLGSLAMWLLMVNRCL